MAEAVIEEVLDVPFTFERRPTPLPCDLRPVWRLHILLLLLDHCWGGKATHQQLHVLDWAIRTDETRRAFLQFIKGKRTPSQTIVRYDPSLNRAVDFAFAEGLAARHEETLGLTEETPPTGSYRVLLTRRGRDLVRELKEMKDCLEAEKAFLAAIGAKVTQLKIEKLFTWGDDQ